MSQPASPDAASGHRSGLRHRRHPLGPSPRRQSRYFREGADALAKSNPKSEGTRNPKSESRDPKQIQNPNAQAQNGTCGFGSFVFWKFGFVSDFEIRISDLSLRGACAMRQVAKGVWLLRGFPPNMCNVYLMEDGLGAAATRCARGRILSQLRRRRPRLVALTHCHPDHQGVARLASRQFKVP